MSKVHNIFYEKSILNILSIISKKLNMAHAPSVRPAPMRTEVQNIEHSFMLSPRFPLKVNLKMHAVRQGACNDTPLFRSRSF